MADDHRHPLPAPPGEVESGTTDELLIATPEMVVFQYRLAGAGSRFLAQLVDFPVQLGLLLLSFLAALGLFRLSGNGNLALLTGLVLGFVSVWGYFPICETLWSGKTLGKHAFGLRVVGDRGEPISFSQALIRNLIRIVDFLPLTYGVGVIVLFINGRGRRLGDLAAGTVVVRERTPVRLSQLRPPAGPGLARPAPAAADSEALRRLAPDLRRLLAAYAARRPDLDPWRRQVLAERLAPVLQRLEPQVVAAGGVLAALDRLADMTGGEQADRPPRAQGST